MSLFERILNTNIINFLIVISTLVWIFKKARLGELLDKLAQDVKESVEKSSQNAQNALAEYKTTKKSVKDTPQLKEEILSNAKNNAQNIKEKIEQKTNIACDEIKNNLEKIYKNQNEKFKNITINDIYQASINLAQDEIVKRLDNDLHRQLINSSINELDKIEGSLS